MELKVQVQKYKTSRKSKIQIFVGPRKQVPHEGWNLDPVLQNNSLKAKHGVIKYHRYAYGVVQEKGGKRYSLFDYVYSKGSNSTCYLTI